MRVHSFFYLVVIMKKTRIQDILGLLHAFAPPSLAEEWDNVGLQVGNPSLEVERVLISLEPSLAAVNHAASNQASLLITHHPLIFKPLKRISTNDPTGTTIFAAIKQNVAIASAHTNLDRAADGLNDWLATKVGLGSAVPLQSVSGNLVKLVVYVPIDHVEKVSAALFAGGAGDIGNYSNCSFQAEGVGTFLPKKGTDPHIGKIGKLERVEEQRLETVVPRHQLSKVVSRMMKAHPYEEVAYDILPMENVRTDVGLGRIGKLETSITLEDMIHRVKEQLGCSHLKVVGDLTRAVQKVAVCGGSGAFLLGEADRQGADLLITGDLKYHEALDARERGIAVIDAGHFATEQIAVEGLCKTLTDRAKEKGLRVEFIQYEGESDPIQGI